MHQPDAHNIPALSLPAHNLPHKPPLLAALNLHLRKPPHLPRRPPALLVLRKRLDDALLALALLKPALSQELGVLSEVLGVALASGGSLGLDLGQRGVARLGVDVAEEPVAVGARGPVEHALLGGALEAAGEGLVDDDFGDAGVGGDLARVLGDGGDADGLAHEPGDALEGEDGVGVVGEGLLLGGGLVELQCCDWEGVRKGRAGVLD